MNFLSTSNISIVENPSSQKNTNYLFLKEKDNYKETFVINEDNLYGLFDNGGSKNKKEDGKIFSEGRIEYDYYIDDNFHTRLFFASLSLLGVWVIYGIYTK